MSVLHTILTTAATLKLPHSHLVSVLGAYRDDALVQAMTRNDPST
jgi:hypothetical protein